MSYQQLPPSMHWDPVMMPDVASGGVLWIWNKPAHDPASLQIEIPWETCVAAREKLTIKQLLAYLRFPLQELTGWSIQGYYYQHLPQNLVVLEQQIPLQVNHSIKVNLHWSPYMGQPNYPQPVLHPGMPVLVNQPQASQFASILQQALEINLNPGYTVNDKLEYTRQIFKTNELGEVSLDEVSPEELRKHMQQMSADWLSILQLERQLTTVRKSMDGLVQRLTTLNRDLTPEENLGADSMDKKDWQDARRWLRDAVTNLNRYIREYDVGITSNAGNRNKLEAIFNEYVQQQLPFPDMLNIRKEFEVHRKLVHNLGLAMQASISNASRDGETRAKMLMARITSKARAKRRKT